MADVQSALQQGQVNKMKWMIKLVELLIAIQNPSSLTFLIQQLSKLVITNKQVVNDILILILDDRHRCIWLLYCYNSHHINEH